MRRSQKFIGSPEWEKRDVVVTTKLNPPSMTAKDTVSGVSVSHYGFVLRATVLAALAHRVKQLSTREEPRAHENQAA